MTTCSRVITLALFVSICSWPALALAQGTARAPTRDLEGLRALVPIGDTVFVTSDTGEILRGVFEGIRSDQGVALVRVDDVPLRLPETGIRQVHRQVRDSTWNGAFRGAGVGGGIGVLLSVLSGESEAYGVVVYGALFGFAAGAAIDAVVKERRLVYRRSAAGPEITVAPRIRPRPHGLSIGARIIWPP